MEKTLTQQIEDAYRSFSEAGALCSGYSIFMAGIAFGALQARMSQEEILKALPRAGGQNRVAIYYGDGTGEPEHYESSILADVLPQYMAARDAPRVHHTYLIPADGYTMSWTNPKFLTSDWTPSS